MNWEPCGVGRNIERDHWENIKRALGRTEEDQWDMMFVRKFVYPQIAFSFWILRRLGGSHPHINLDIPLSAAVIRRVRYVLNALSSLPPAPQVEIWPPLWNTEIRWHLEEVTESWGLCFMNGLSDKLVNELVDSSIHILVDWRIDELFWSDSIIKRELSVMLSLAIVRLHHASHSRKTLPGAVCVPASCV